MANNPVFHSQYTAQQIENEITNGVPKIVDGYWWRWDIATGTWVNTGDSAEGANAYHGLADDFDDAASYAVGDLVIYNGELYVCTTAHTGAWDAADFAQTTVDAQFAKKAQVEDTARYGVCSTAADVALKTVTVPKTVTLEAGVGITVKFANGNTALGVMLSVNGLAQKGLCISRDTWRASADDAIPVGAVLDLVYDGTFWVITNKSIASNTVYGSVKVDNAPTSGSNNVPSSGGVYTQLALKAPLASPALTGNPTAPTPPSADNSTKVATTAFVHTAIAALSLSVVDGMLCITYEEV